MSKRSSLQNPSDFGDIFTVLLAATIIISVFSFVIEDDSFQDIIVILMITTFGWVAWAVHRVLVKHTEEQDEKG